MNSGASDFAALAPGWLAAAASAPVDAAIRELMAEVSEEIRKQRPLCVASGRCCHFESFGHRLYVTGLEVAWTWRQVAQTPTAGEVEGALGCGSCPFLKQGLCSIHTVRPLACRLFFCDRLATEWQQALHERLHARMRSLHEEHGVEYRYAEWRALLAGFAGHADGGVQGRPHC
jgi:Fe-S-cluster containining protein